MTRTDPLDHFNEEPLTRKEITLTWFLYPFCTVQECRTNLGVVVPKWSGDGFCLWTKLPEMVGSGSSYSSRRVHNT